MDGTASEIRGGALPYSGEMMAFTSHGHYIIGSKKIGTQPKQKTRCYGSPRCWVCKRDVDKYWEKNGAGAEPEKRKAVEVIQIEDLSRSKKARTLVENYILDGYDERKSGIKVEAFVMKITASGDNWKALLTSNYDSNIYEVVYLARLKVAQITMYTKAHTTNVQDGAD